MAGRTTVFLTPEETQRVTQKFKLGAEQRQARAGEPWKAENRKGLIQHATSTSLMQELSLASLGFGGAAAPKKDDSMMTYAIGAPYPPCVVDAKELKPIKLAELQLESHHRGKKLTVRRVSPVAELKTSSWAVVEAVGEDADQVVVVETYLHKQRLGKDLLDSASEFAIKEPYYTLNGDNEAVIRINHPSDLVITAFSEDPESWRDNYEVEDPAVTPEQFKEKGNAALAEQRYSLAHAYYTRGIAAADADADSASTLPQDIRRNRAHVNLILQRYDEASADALASLTNGASPEQQSLDAKAYFRAGTAAYALGDFDEAKRCFAEQDRLQPGNKTTQINVRRTAKRLEEQAKGNHDMNKVVASLPKTQGRPDVASFDGDTVVKSSPGAGSGLFAARDFKSGELIMCEKAFCIVSSKDKAGAAVTALTVDLDEDYAIRVFPAGLHRAVVQKLLNNPSQASKILSLDSGAYHGVGAAGASTAEGPVVDAFQVHHVVQRNAFGLGPQSDDEDVTNATTGLWARASRLNHACAANSVKDFAGDLLVLRAARMIRAGEEITHTYDENGDHDARQAALQKTWGFRCGCALCVVEAEDGEAVRARRRELIKEANEFAQGNNPNGAKIVAVTKAKRLRKALEDTYDEKRFKDLPRLATKVIDHWLAIAQR
ncbi:TPR domain protein [Cordyceps fumosorosea ARSEF 2679]|uniref:TPR domain protein n=1 Tax=Cordyceps fumosorosea (strain ARSEF 2679) TaxID=1081104 RepID=A0A167T1T4_CORFA|nr:TPR domain protein [Cordyceps fumosorosea ARSEF 2679]OAA60161.1 TPR domain protein [Cordyceps fumosorosea ARSEF 2679]